MRTAIAEVAGIAGVHDLHLWSVAGEDASLTAHAILVDGADGEASRRAVAEMLEARFAIHHATIQMEEEPCGGEDNLHA